MNLSHLFRLRFWQESARVLWHIIRRFESEERRRDAAALTYTTLFALVPVVTVTYSILSAIPALQQSIGDDANRLLLSYVMPEGSEVIQDYLYQFSAQARNLTWVGVFFLFITAFLLLRTIELQFNRIWNVERPRAGLQPFFRYWAVLTLGPLLFAAVLASSSLLVSFPWWSESSGVLLTLVQGLPWLLTVLALMGLYILVPNCHVPFGNAVVAAAWVATVFELAKMAFAGIIGLFPSYQLIYGAFAAAPLFLLWLYFTWILILLGAEFSYGLSHRRLPNKSRDPIETRLAVLASLYQSQQEKQTLSEPHLLKRLRGHQPDAVSDVLAHFRQSGWLVQSDDQTWVLIVDVHQLTLHDLLADLSLQQIAKAQIRLPEVFARMPEWSLLLEQDLQQPLDQFLPSTTPL